MPHTSAWIITLAAVINCLTADFASAEGAKTLFSQWSKQFDDNFFGQPKTDHPLFVELLKQEDADLVLLEGLHHRRDPVRRLSQWGLSQLKTDRSFEALKQGTNDKNMFVRERCLEALGDFHQPRCVDVLLNVLQNDPHFQPRQRAAAKLVLYPERRVQQALMRSLKNETPMVAIAAASALAGLEVSEAIEPTYRLILATKSDHQREMAIWALRRHHHKKAIDYLLAYWKRDSSPNDPSKMRELSGIRAVLQFYARQTLDVFHPLPDSLEQWQAWWKETEPLFREDMVRPAMAERSPVLLGELGNDVSQLTFQVSLDAKTYRYGDPIAIDLTMQNRSAKPMRTIPPVQSGWWPTMAYGVRLERLEDDPVVIFDHAPSDLYIGSYSGPPAFHTFRPQETYQNRQCLHDWLRYFMKGHWPLTEGEYRLTVTFDNSEFAGARPQKGGVLHRWPAASIEFFVAGIVQTDPEKLLKMLSQKTGLRWLKEDLNSESRERRDAAWLAIHRWGDNRLEPYLSRLPRYAEYHKQWGQLLRPFEP